VTLLVLALRLATLAWGEETYYEIGTVAGSDRLGDGGPAINAQLHQPEGLAVDRAGNLYIADPDTHRVRRVAPDGIITTIAGTGQPGFRGDGGPANQARLTAPYGVAVDAQGNLYIADTYNHRIRVVNAAGEIRAFAGTGIKGSGGDGGPAISAQLMAPRNVAVDSLGNVYVSEFEGHRVRRIAPDGVIYTAAGTGIAGLKDGLATAAQLASPAGLAVDLAGAVYITDIENNRVRKLANGALTTIYGPTRRDLTSGYLYGTMPVAVACDGTGGVYIAERSMAGVMRLLPGGDSIAVSKQLFLAPRDLTVDAAGVVYVSDGRRVRKIGSNGAVLPVAGEQENSAVVDGSPAAESALVTPRGIAFDAKNNLYIAEAGAHRIRRLDSTGLMFSVVANAGADAGLKAPSAVGFDTWGYVLISDTGNHRLRRLLTGHLSPVAGTGSPGRGGDGIPATEMPLSSPGQFVTDRAGNIYLADSGNHRVVRITAAGVASVVAGNGSPGYAGDGGPAVNAQLNLPAAVALDSAANLYIADTGNSRVRKVTPEGVILTVAGDGKEGVAGSRLAGPCALAIQGSTLFISDSATVRRLEGAVLETIAGDGALGFEGDGGPALQAQLKYPCGLAVDPEGRIWIADSGNHRIRRLTPKSRIMSPEPLKQISIVHAASLREGPVAPGQIVTLLGSNLGRQVYFDGRPGRVFHFSDTQINAQVPYALTGQSGATVEVRENGEVRGTAALTLTPAAPALFTVAGGKGQAIALNQDGTLNSTSNPALKGSQITLYATGEGQTHPPATDDSQATEPLPKPVQPVSLTVSGQPANISYAGMAPGFPGLMQINARLPGAFGPSGVMELILKVGAASSPAGVTIVVK
jgi:uncharacterized protein (TIGR03437 family)